MSQFSVLICTATPPGVGGESGGAFVKIDGREALLKSVELFLNRENVKQIQVAFLPSELEEAKRKYGGHLGLFGVKVISGGPKWVDQLNAAAGKIAAEATHVIVHDAARPAVPYADIDALMEAAANYSIVSLAAAVKNQLVEIDEGENAMALHAARGYWQVLWPQVFKKEKFVELATAKKEPHASELKLIKGSPLNVRINSPADASFVKAMIGLLPKPKIKAGNNPFEEAQW